MEETWYPSSQQLFINNLNKTSNSISPKKEWVKMKYEWMPLLNATRSHLCTSRTIRPSNHEHIFLKAPYCSTVTFTTQELNCRVFCILIVVTKCYPNYSYAWLGRIAEQFLKIVWYRYIKVTVVMYLKKHKLVPWGLQKELLRRFVLMLVTFLHNFKLINDLYIAFKVIPDFIT